MSRLDRILAPAALATMLMAGGPAAEAACLVSSVTSVSTAVANLGTYTAPALPAVQAISMTVQGQYLVTLGGIGGGCSLSIFFQRAALPPQMSIDGGGGATLAYALQSASTGGNSLVYSGGGVPPTSNMVTAVFSPPAVLGTGSYTVNFTVYGQLLPTPPQQGGSYSDPLTLTLVGDVLNLLPTIVATRQFTVIGNVTKTCTIGGASTPAADSASISVNGGVVDTSPILRSYANVACNSPSTLLLSSVNGALVGPPPIGGSFEAQINYSAQATFSGAIAALSTATIPAAVGPEDGLPATISGTMPQGTLSLTITPAANLLPLVRGSYADTLRITITPN